jgi:hypothetical protein
MEKASPVPFSEPEEAYCINEARDGAQMAMAAPMQSA